MPQLHPAPRTDTSSEACSLLEESSTYRLLVILQPPPGHSFIPESTKQRRAGRIRVELECLCSGEQLPGQECFLHSSGGDLPWHQDWYLLDTLCTGSFLDAEKVTRWLRMLVPLAWRQLPYSSHWQLTALPSRRKFYSPRHPFGSLAFYPPSVFPHWSQACKPLPVILPYWMDIGYCIVSTP
ncbi:hypothetical protein HGM15179_019883 [Zosterops borbonicus]|uniref:IPIL1 protein n=1 Tax=Zosterops borbonicus TaxID=364589 RepID=A0A8K1FXB3_9PASS|nr:hypothetical protein HGM15179_019883 [Zosterops borbonicus]